MSNLKAEEIREIYLERLKEDLIGPKNGPNEVISEDPISRYLCGILWPSNTPPDEEDYDQIDDQEDDQYEETVVDRATDIFRQLKPACAGLSFHYEYKKNETPEIEIKLNLATYKEISKDADEYDNELFDGSQDEEKTQWLRNPFDYKARLKLDKEYYEEEINISDDDPFQLKITVYSKKIPSENTSKDKRSITIKVINLMSIPEDEEDEKTREYYVKRAEASIFQFEMELCCLNNSSFCARPIRTVADDEDSKLSELIYRDFPEFATGHICSVSWDQKNNQPKEIKTEWMPRYEVAQTSAEGADEIQQEIHKETGSKTIKAKDIAFNKQTDVIQQLNSLIKGYEVWLSKEKKKIENLDKKLLKQAEKNIETCELAKNRMMEGLNLLDKDQTAFQAFSLANEAMQIQFNWNERARLREESKKPGDKEFILAWRPFQIGFTLLSLASVSDPEHVDRNTFDLLWFPTGGGKTEAYFLLIAYLLFLRRLKGEDGVDSRHVDVFMRYTLRALTEQQFQRASTMIFACDFIRKRDDLGSTPFSIGLWVGGDSSPNNVEDLNQAISLGNAHNSPKKIFECPSCGHSLHSDIEWEPRIAWITSCTTETCDLFGELPISTCDFQIYDQPPSLLIATVDKFAQIVRRGPMSNLKNEGSFALFNESFPPEMIIQDELHLINGPLGSMVGILEAGIDLLCENQGNKVKIIGSTATIRQAKKQVKRVFARDSFQFPPPSIDFSDSGFSVENTDDPGRLYVGITSEGRTEKMIRENLTASVLQSLQDSRLSNQDKDIYSSLVSYFGSLRILGGALDGIQDSRSGFMNAYAGQRNEQVRTPLSPPEELTSRVNSTDLTEILKNVLTRPFGDPKHVEVILATNMISVGVDIPRLNLMSVNGQPKSMTEYIQSTSRVGRRDPGLVLTLYNHARIRDKSFYENFQTWHSSLYRSVEASTVTPFAPNAMVKALHQPLMAVYRHRISRGQRGAARIETNTEKYTLVLEAIERILERIEYCMDGTKERSDAEDWFDRILHHWLSLSQDRRPDGSYNLTQFWNEKAPSRSLLISSETAATRKARGRRDLEAFPTPNSVRNVDVSSFFKLIFENANPTTRRGRRRMFGRRLRG